MPAGSTLAEEVEAAMPAKNKEASFPGLKVEACLHCSKVLKAP